MSAAILANLFENVKSRWATSPLFQALVIAPPIFVGAALFVVVVLLVF